MVTCPYTPEWKRYSEFDLNGEALLDEDDDRGNNHNETEGVMTNDDVLGDSTPQDQKDSFRQFCYQALKLSAGVFILGNYFLVSHSSRRAPRGGIGTVEGHRGI